MASDRPGLLVYNASEVATLAGGVRRGAAQGDIALLTDSPAVAAYQGRIVAVGYANGDFGVARFTADGQLDTSFAGTGTARFDSGGYEYANVVAFGTGYS